MLLLLTTILSAFAAEYGPPLEGDVMVAESAEPADTGVVGCSDLSLQDGSLLPDLPLFFNRMQPDHAWGTREMVDLIVESSRHMRWLLPDADPIAIGEISARKGGLLYGHKSHRGGVDADIGLYRSGGRQTPHMFERPAPGEFDLEANWMLISTFLDTGKVDMILLDRSHIARLRAYTLRAGLLTEEEADQIFVPEGKDSWGMVGVVRHVAGHEDHLHVRVLCSDGSKASAR
ncbi:hypothetical protein LBMAG42_49180 [Deltaproteobacteria bacterium]|nr:hypothetical protein LBMAG42_49180 [Deltaproteobacteria bacterium]